MFLTTLDVREIGWREGRVIWELLSPLVYQCENGTIVTVPVGFQTDFCSVPRHPPFVFGLFGGKFNRTGVMHDYACRVGSVPEFTFEEANDLFLECCYCAWPEENDDRDPKIMYRVLNLFAKKYYHQWDVMHKIIEPQEAA